MKPARSATVLVLLLLLAACRVSDAGDGAAVAASVPPAMQATVPARAAAPPTGAIVEEHARGIFFDARQLAQERRRVAESSRPSAAALERVAVMDAGLGQPEPAATIEVPSGWNGRGGVQWERSVECIGNTWGLHWSATSPDGLHAVALLPRLSWQVESAGVVAMNPCPAAPMASAREYVDYVLRNARPGARVIAWRERPDIVAAAAAASRAAGMANLRHEAGELLVGYRLGGQEMRETLVASVTFSDLQGSVQATADTLFAMRAPDGLLDFALAERIRASLRTERAWGERMLAWSRQHVEQVNQRQIASIQAWHQRRMNEITTAGILARGRIRQKTMADIARINSEIVASRSASDERNHARFIDAVQEVQPWRDPSSGQQVDLSIHYANAWQLADGRQFLTNDANFDPARDLGLAAHRLEPVR